MKIRPIRWVAALTLAAALGITAQASASTVKGTVVHANKRAHVLVVAGRSGKLAVISSRRSARAGSVVSVSVRRLRNGTLAARKLRVLGHHHLSRTSFKLEGVVLSADPSAETITISGDDDEGDDAAQMSDHGGDDQGDDDSRPAIVVHVPDASAFTVGDKVELIVSGPASDGSFTLVSVDEQDGQDAGDDNHGDGHGDNSGPGGDDHGHDGSGGEDG